MAVKDYPAPCKSCGQIYYAYPSDKRLYCSKKCYATSLLKNRSLEYKRLIVNQRAKKWRDKNRHKLLNLCSCGKEKWLRSRQCYICRPSKFVKGQVAPNYKGGYENHLKHNRERLSKLKIIGNHTPQEWNELKVKYNFMCLCCKQQEPIIQLSRDHIVPISKGGTDDIGNIQPLCRSCNSRKHNKIISYIELSKSIMAGTNL